jgi:hypothetical protein
MMGQRNVMHSQSSSGGGFQGAIGSIPLADLLQVWSINRFSGVVTVSSGDRTGHLYFVEGEVVHAEAGGTKGEPAVGMILGWPEGSFELFPNTTTLHRTIEKGFSHLMLDAHRTLDEHRRDTAGATSPPEPTEPSRPSPARAPAAPPPATAAGTPGAREPARAGVLEQVRAIPGVTQVVRFGKDGRPSGDGSPAAEALAAKGLYLAMNHAAFVAEAFGLHEVSLVTVRGARESFVLVHSRGNHLCVAAAPGAPLEPIVAQLRVVLTRQPSR